jgi:monofunctional biosynthetic peptidoglycan transglycosylase
MHNIKVVSLFFAVAVGALLIAVTSITAWIPSSAEIKGCMTTSMYQVELCPTSSRYVPLSQISSYLQKTIILTEDGNFYNHHGFEWGTIEKNFREGWESGKFKRGGSTITQQLAKNMFLTKDRTFIRKGLEAIITDRIEKTLTKKEILERYLNIVEFGNNIYGVKSAAQAYFKKTPAQLTVVESAFLALVLPNPVQYSKSYYKKELTPFVRKRLNEIVGNMFRYSRINQAEYDAAVYQIQYFFNPEPPADMFEAGSDDKTTLKELEESADYEESVNVPTSDGDPIENEIQDAERAE